MNNSFIKIKLLTLFMSLFVISTTFAQSEFSYSVINGPVFPITGSTYQINGTAHLNDSTLNIVNLNFDVWLNSFTGIHADYLSWVGNANTYPNLRFKSSKVENAADGKFKVSGQLEFRGQWMPQTITVTESKTADGIVLEGNFQLNTGDFFIIPPSNDIVPDWIPMKFTLQFSKEAVFINVPKAPVKAKK